MYCINESHLEILNYKARHDTQRILTKSIQNIWWKILKTDLITEAKTKRNLWDSKKRPKIKNLHEEGTTKKTDQEDVCPIQNNVGKASV